MKKIIAAFDGLKFSHSTSDYAVQIAKQENAHLVGIFLDDFSYHSYKVYDLIRAEGEHFENRQKELDRKDDQMRIASAEEFRSACLNGGIEFTVHHDRSVALQELIHESIYADLVIVDAAETLTHYPEKMPTRFIRDFLSDAQCPVLLVPHKHKAVDRIVLLYDGEPSSVFAIRMFSTTLTALSSYPVEVISVNPPNRSLHLPDNRLMKEFMKRHFPSADYTVLKGLPEIEIVNYLKEQAKPALIVLGAYRRGSVSRWFRESMADVLIKELKLPLFIAHNK